MELESGLRLFIDTAPIIYFIEEHPLYSSEVSRIFEGVSKGYVEVVTSVVTLIEVLTKPYKLGQTDIVNIYKDFFYNSKGLSIIQINNEIAELTACIRAEFEFKLPDAVQLAIFKFSGCDYFITNDKHLKKYDNNKVLVLNDGIL